MDEYYFEKTITLPNAIINIYRPIITEEERARRMKEIEKAAVRLAIANRRAEAQRLAAEQT